MISSGVREPSQCSYLRWSRLPGASLFLTVTKSAIYASIVLQPKEAIDCKTHVMLKERMRADLRVYRDAVDELEENKGAETFAPISEYPAECCAQPLQPVEEFLALFPGA